MILFGRKRTSSALVTWFAVASILWGTLVLEWSRNTESEVTHYTMWKIAVNMDTLRTEERNGTTYYYIDSHNPQGAVKVGDDIPQPTAGEKVEGSIPNVGRSDLINYAWFVIAHGQVHGTAQDSGPSNVVHCGKDQDCIDRYLKPKATTGIRTDPDGL
jgi:hypothetical protein